MIDLAELSLDDISGNLDYLSDEVEAARLHGTDKELTERINEMIPFMVELSRRLGLLHRLN